MKPASLKTKIFLDGATEDETAKILSLLGFLDGFTTNPTHISKHPKIILRLAKGKLNQAEALQFYQQVVKRISNLIPAGSVSIQVCSDQETSVNQMLAQAREMFSWTQNAQIKFPLTYNGLSAASLAIREGIRINMTLCFSQQQAAAVYAATSGAKKGDVFVSTFVGRLDDVGLNGMDLIKNTLDMFKKGDRHVEVLTASVRNFDHLLYAIALGTDIISAPYKILEEWGKKKLVLPSTNYSYPAKKLKSVKPEEVNLDKNWLDYNISHQLTDLGVKKFAQDWQSLLI